MCIRDREGADRQTDRQTNRFPAHKISLMKPGEITASTKKRSQKCHRFQNFEAVFIKLSEQLTLIIAPDEMRKSVARSFTFLIRAAASDWLSSCSRSPRARCRATQCFVTRSPQVRTSDSLVLSSRSVESSSCLSGTPLLLIDAAPIPSSSSSRELTVTSI